MEDPGATMRQAQGVEPSNPYQTLQLHPAAPRELIDEAYWTLVERVRTAKASSANERALSALNSAYAALSDAERRQQVDQQLDPACVRSPSIRLRRSGIWPLGGMTFASDHTDLYHLLRVDRGADTAIIALARRVLDAQASGSTAKAVFLRRTLQDAYEVLGNPARRAAYDMSTRIGERSPLAPGTRAEEANPPVGVQARPVPDVAAARNSSVDDFTAVPRATERTSVGAASMPPEKVRVDQEPLRGATIAAAPVNESNDVAAEPVTAPSNPATHRGRTWIGALRGALVAGIAQSEAHAGMLRKPSAAEDAEQRILTLRNGHDDAGAPPPHPEPDAAAAGAELIFIDGPRAGARVPLGHDALTMGSSQEADVMLADDSGEIAPQHARIWQHGDHFILRQIAENGTLVDGESLALQLVMLDDGDEIQIGAHRMRFSLAG